MYISLLVLNFSFPVEVLSFHFVSWHIPENLHCPVGLLLLASNSKPQAATARCISSNVAWACCILCVRRGLSIILERRPSERKVWLDVWALSCTPPRLFHAMRDCWASFEWKNGHSCGSYAQNLLKKIVIFPPPPRPKKEEQLCE